MATRERQLAIAQEAKKRLDEDGLVKLTAHEILVVVEAYFEAKKSVENREEKRRREDGPHCIDYQDIGYFPGDCCD